MNLRKALALLVGPAIASAMLVPLAQSAGAAPPAVAICGIAGTVAVTPGVGEIPPGAPAVGAGYTFSNVAVVCAGVVAGAAASVADTGSFGPGCGGAPEPPVLGQFCDSGYSANGFTLGTLTGNQNCTGNVGGAMPKAITDAWAKIATQNPGATGTGSDPTVGPWSLTAGALIEGNITMSCTGPTSAVPRMTNGRGVISLVAEPDPLQTNTAAGVTLGRNCPSTGPLSLPVIGQLPVGPQAWWCGIIVEGVSVIAL